MRPTGLGRRRRRAAPLGTPSAPNIGCGGRGQPGRPDLSLIPDGADYLLRGRKNFATGVSTGDASVVSGTVRRADGTLGEHLLVVVRGDDPGCTGAGTGQPRPAPLRQRQRHLPRRADHPGTRGRRARRGPRHPRASLVTPAIQSVFGTSTSASPGRPGHRPGVHPEHLPPWLLSDSTRAAATLTCCQLRRLVSSYARSRRWPTSGDSLARADAAGAGLTWEARGELAS